MTTVKIRTVNTNTIGDEGSVLHLATSVNYNDTLCMLQISPK